MEDNAIIDLYWSRSEDAISETALADPDAGWD